MDSLEEEISLLFSEPGIGATNINVYGEENIRNLVQKYNSLAERDKANMLDLLKSYSRSGDLNSCYISVAVLHALGQLPDVSAAYDWAKTQEDSAMYTRHFDIGVALANYLEGF